MQCKFLLSYNDALLTEVIQWNNYLTCVWRRWGDGDGDGRKARCYRSRSSITRSPFLTARQMACVYSLSNYYIVLISRDCTQKGKPKILHLSGCSYRGNFHEETNYEILIKGWTSSMIITEKRFTPEANHILIFKLKRLCK